MTKTTLATPAPNALPNAKSQAEIQPEGCASDAFIKAVKDGDLDLARAIYEQDPDQAACTSEIVQLAAVCFKEGHLQVLKWIHDHSYRFAAPAMLRGATNSGSIETVLWIIDNYPDAYELSKCIRMDNAAGYDNLHMIKWFHERDFFLSKTAIDTAAQNGFLEIVQWLHENRADDCSTWAMDSAATFGHLGIVMFLHFHRTEGCTGEIVTKAVGKSNVPVLEWLHANKRELVNLEAIRALAEQTSKHEVVAWVDAIAQGESQGEEQEVAQEEAREDSQNEEEDGVSSACSSHDEEYCVIASGTTSLHTKRKTQEASTTQT